MNKEKRRIILAGGSGFLGRALAAHFLKIRCEVIILTRRPRKIIGSGREVAWDANNIGPWQQELEGATAVINLTGRSVDCRYTARNRKEILDSRVNSTRVLAEAIRCCARPPPVWLNASTATLYRHTFGDTWDESGQIEAVPEAKDAFSVEVGKAWERAFKEAETPRTRKIALRIAMVIGLGKNSVYPVLRRLVHLGLGGRMGSGRQFVSWIHEQDFCRAVEWLILQDGIHGPVNLAAPNPIPNCEMMKSLRQSCRVPFGLPAMNWTLEAGAFLLRTETELIIKSRRVIPRLLLDSGFRIQFPRFRHAIADLEHRCKTRLNK